MTQANVGIISDVTTLTTHSEVTSLTTISDVTRLMSQTTYGVTPTTSDDVKGAGGIMWLPWENLVNVASHAMEQLFYVVCECGVSNALCLLGMPLNLLNLVVFAKQGLKDRINILLLSLSVSDMVLDAMMVAKSAPCWPSDPIHARNVLVVVNNIVFYFTYIFSSISQFLVAIISVDRCVTLTFPFVAKRLAKVKYTLLSVLATYVFFLAIYVPHMFVFDLIWVTDAATNRSVLYPVMNEFGVARMQTLYIFSRDLSILAVKPLGTALVVAFSLFTLVQIRRASKSRAQMTSSDSGSQSSADVKITRMLLFLSAVSVLCVVPETAISYVHLFVPEFTYYAPQHNIFLIMFHVTYVFWSLNSSVNFFIYLLMSSKFKRTLLTLLPWCGKCVKAAAGQGHGKSSYSDSGQSSAVTEQSAVM